MHGKLFRERRQRSLVARGQRDDCARSDERARGCGADTPAGPGDDGGSALERGWARPSSLDFPGTQRATPACLRCVLVCLIGSSDHGHGTCSDSPLRVRWIEFVLVGDVRLDESEVDL
jgi:hypothetical protein